MIPQLLIVGGALYLIFKNKDGKVVKPKPLPEPEPEPAPVTPNLSQYSWNGVTSGDELGIDSAEGIVVWEYGVLKGDGTSYETYIVIGDQSHTSFLRSSSDVGTIDIPAEASGGVATQTNVEVFKSVYDAERKLRSYDEKDDPESPQRPESTPTSIGEQPTRLGQGYGTM